MKKKSDINEESIRLAIQAGVVASCLVVISGDYSTLTPQFQSAVKLLALILGLISMSYIMLTARKYSFKKTAEFKIRPFLYSTSITFYWYIFVSIVYIFASNFLTLLTGISFERLYIVTLIIITAIIVIALIMGLTKKHKMNKKQ